MNGTADLLRKMASGQPAAETEQDLKQVEEAGGTRTASVRKSLHLLGPVYQDPNLFQTCRQASRVACKTIIAVKRHANCDGCTHHKNGNCGMMTARIINGPQDLNEGDAARIALRASDRGVPKARIASILKGKGTAAERIAAMVAAQEQTDLPEATNPSTDADAVVASQTTQATLERTIASPMDVLTARPKKVTAQRTASKPSRVTQAEAIVIDPEAARDSKRTAKTLNLGRTAGTIKPLPTPRPPTPIGQSTFTGRQTVDERRLRSTRVSRRPAKVEAHETLDQTLDKTVRRTARLLNDKKLKLPDADRMANEISTILDLGAKRTAAATRLLQQLFHMRL